MKSLENLRKQILAQQPTEQQESAIFADELEFLLRAAPGSGKTWTSCRRFIWRGANWPYSKGGLALLSFTNVAIREFQTATIKVGRRDLLSEPNYVGTFDSFIERFIITPFGHLISGTLKRPKLFITPKSTFWKNKKLTIWSISKKTLIPAWEIVPYTDGSFRASTKYGGYELKFTDYNPVTELMSLGFYTHEQRAYWCYQLLNNRPHIADVIARRFSEIIVDEAQDTNVWLLLILDCLRDKGSKITLVGDPDQCIYEFSMAHATSLQILKKEWKIPEKPLSKSFRCNDQIANAVRNIGENKSFSGRGPSTNQYHRPFIIKEESDQFEKSIAGFIQTLKLAEIAEDDSCILCRGHQQLESIRGEVNYINLRGITKDLAKASFYRDCRKDYKQAFQAALNSLRSITNDSEIWEKVDNFPESEITKKVKLATWSFVKSQSCLPNVEMIGDEWISQLRLKLRELLIEIGFESIPNLNLKIKKTGLDELKLKLPLFAPQKLFPKIRQETIHKVKGESIDAVLVLGSGMFWNSVLNSINTGNNSEERRLAYVAMTRAQNLLVLGLPAEHFEKYSKVWVSWGFDVL